MADSPQKYWFRSKYGFGWYPVNWKGFIVLSFYFIFLGYIFWWLFTGNSMITAIILFLPFLIGASITLLFISYLTGEPIKEDNLKI